jgi:hypothetical protein
MCREARGIWMSRLFLRWFDNFSAVFHEPFVETQSSFRGLAFPR